MEEVTNMYREKEKELIQSRSDVDSVSKSLKETQLALDEEKKLHSEQVALFESRIKEL